MTSRKRCILCVQRVTACFLAVVCLSTTTIAQQSNPEAAPARGVLIDDVKGDNAAVGKDVNPSGVAEPDSIGPVPKAIAKWEDDIKKLEALDQTEPDPADAILFVGSSSIRLWANIDRDMAPYRTVRRGYGGAKYSDAAHYASRLITPHDYRALVLFVGNDVSGSDRDHTPDQVETWVLEILGVAKAHRPDSPIFIVEVTPTPVRFDAWPKLRELNQRLREISLREPNTYFVSTAGHYLRADKTPRESLFGDDRLHQNEAGYALWSSLIRRRLTEVFQATASQSADVAAEVTHD